MSELPPDVWVPIPLRWRHVAPGDVTLGREGDPWVITRCEPSQELIAVQAARSGDPINTYCDPDDTVQVLVPVTERDAVELCREELGARLTAQRTV